MLLRTGVKKERLAKELPFLGVLLKKEQDVELVTAMKKGWKA